jgi:hypothetical protein
MRSWILAVVVGAALWSLPGNAQERGDATMVETCSRSEVRLLNPEVQVLDNLGRPYTVNIGPDGAGLPVGSHYSYTLKPDGVPIEFCLDGEGGVGAAGTTGSGDFLPEAADWSTPRPAPAPASASEDAQIWKPAPKTGPQNLVPQNLSDEIAEEAPPFSPMPKPEAKPQAPVRIRIGI